YVRPGCSAANGTPSLRGREIDDRDTTTDPPVIVVNEAFARRFFLDKNPIGGIVAIKPERVGVVPIPRTVVGVAGDAVYQTVRENVRPTMYLPLAQSSDQGSFSSVEISIRSAAGSPVALSR